MNHPPKEKPPYFAFLFLFVLQYKGLEEVFWERVIGNTRRYVGIFADAVDELMPEPTEAVAADEDRDILMTQRVDETSDSADPTIDAHQKMPSEIKRFL